MESLNTKDKVTKKKLRKVIKKHDKELIRLKSKFESNLKVNKTKSGLYLENSKEEYTYK